MSTQGCSKCNGDKINTPAIFSLLPVTLKLNKKYVVTRPGAMQCSSEKCQCVKHENMEK